MGEGSHSEQGGGGKTGPILSRDLFPRVWGPVWTQQCRTNNRIACVL